MIQRPSGDQAGESSKTLGTAPGLPTTIRLPVPSARMSHTWPPPDRGKRSNASRRPFGDHADPRDDELVGLWVSTRMFVPFGWIVAMLMPAALKTVIEIRPACPGNVASPVPIMTVPSIETARTLTTVSRRMSPPPHRDPRLHVRVDTTVSRTVADRLGVTWKAPPRPIPAFDREQLR